MELLSIFSHSDWLDMLPSCYIVFNPHDLGFTYHSEVPLLYYAWYVPNYEWGNPKHLFKWTIIKYKLSSIDIARLR